MKDNRPYWLIENPKTNEFYYGVKDLQGHPIFGKNVHKSIAKFIDKENAWEAIINDGDLCELECVPTEHIDFDNRIEHISSDKPLSTEQIKAVNELVEKAYNMDFSKNKKSYITELIDKYFNQDSEWRGLKPSIEHYLNKGKATGGFYCALIEFASAYYKRASLESPKRPLSQLADDVETCKAVAELLGMSLDVSETTNFDDSEEMSIALSSEGAYKQELLCIKFSGTMELWSAAKGIIPIPNCVQIVQLLLGRGYEVG